MTTAKEIEREFLGQGEVRGGILLLRVDDALALIESARRKNVRVLGVDAFKLSDNTTQPMMEHSLDLSSGETREETDTWSAASGFIKHRELTDLHFEIVLR